MFGRCEWVSIVDAIGLSVFAIYDILNSDNWTREKDFIDIVTLIGRVNVIVDSEF